MVFLDLDGPILDCKARHHACYADICREHGLTALPPAEYWECKRHGMPGRDIFARGGARDADELLRAWIEAVERPQYLALDTIHPGVEATLGFWTERGLRLHLATLRRNPGTLRAQLGRLRLDRFFDRITVSNPRDGARGKAEPAARDLAPEVVRASTWIGDTEVDARAAAALQCANLFLVTCGIRDELYLHSLQAGEIIADLAAIRNRLAV